jgi:hypothetical protein
MKQAKWLLPVFCAGFTLFGSAAFAQAPHVMLKDLQARGLTPLSGEKLRELLPGNTLYHINPANGFRVPLYYVADGTRFVRIRGKVLRTTWRVQGDRVCEESVVLNREVCRHLYRTDGIGAVCDEGADGCAYGLDWAAGNPERLGD